MSSIDDIDAEPVGDVDVISEAPDDTASDADDEDEEYVDVPRLPPTEYSVVINVVPKDQRKTSRVLSKFELTEILNIRITQIGLYNNCMVNTDGAPTAREQALRELASRKVPLILRRLVGERLNEKTGKLDRYVELWSPNDMLVIHDL